MNRDDIEPTPGSGRTVSVDDIPELIESNPDDASPSLLCVPLAGVIDKDALHRPCCCSEKMRAAAEILDIPNEAKKRLVHKRSRLQGVVLSLATHLPGRDSSKFRVNRLEQSSCRIGFAGFHLIKEERDIGSVHSIPPV